VAQQEEIQIIWRAFELRPEGVPQLDPNSDYIVNAWNNHIVPMAKELGVVMNKPPVQPRTRLAHEAFAFARQQGREPAMAEALFKAHFEHGRDIGQIEVLCDLGLSVGVDPVALRGALENRTMQAEVQQELDFAARAQITGVPFFIFNGRYAANGLQSEEGLRRAIAMARGEGLLQVE
jgi:predicted DsbA family dithiol-disulfide isomerase